jgi:hypothetical protein
MATKSLPARYYPVGGVTGGKTQRLGEARKISVILIDYKVSKREPLPVAAPFL